MPRDVFEFSCPCCGKRVELDVRTGKARAVRFEESRRGKSLDDLLQDQRTEGQRLTQEFDTAQRDHESTKERLEDMFSDAKREAARNPDEKPRHPFQDLD